jgi:hypothetical protein
MIETLESRRLFAITATEGYPGYIDVIGTNNAESIAIYITNASVSIHADGQQFNFNSVLWVGIQGLDGDDAIYAFNDGSATAVITGGNGNDYCYLEYGGLFGGPGNDYLQLGPSQNGQIWGEGGDDMLMIIGDAAYADIRGGDGNDFIDATESSYGVQASGGSGNDTFWGTQHHDSFYGDSGTDEGHSIDNNFTDDFYSVENNYGGYVHI